MFYTNLLFNKRGALSKIWIAAHWDKKLTKAHIFECNLESAIQNIISTKITIALRTSGHLLLGVVRIYHRKTKYLLADCNEAFVKMKMSFRPGAVDLAEDNQKALYNSITLPEEFHEFDIHLPDIKFTDVVDHFTLNQSRPEDITLPEDYGRAIILHDGFGGEGEALRHDRLFDGSFEVSTNSFQPENHSASFNEKERGLFTQDCFGDEGLLSNFFDDKPLNAVDNGLIESFPEMDSEVLFSPFMPEKETEAEAEVDPEFTVPTEPVKSKSTVNYSTLTSEQDGFVLEPVDVTELQEKKKSKKKRILRVDQLKEVASSAMRQQLLDFSDTLTTVDIAPPTRKLMTWKMMGGVDWLLSHPCQPMINSHLLMIFTNSLTNKHRKSTTREEQSEPEIEKMRPEQQVMDHTEMPQLEDSSHLQESHITDRTTSVSAEILPIINDAGQNEGPSSLQESIDHLSDSSGPMPIFPTTEHLECMDNAQNSEEQGFDKRTQEILVLLRKLNQRGLTTFSFQKLSKNNSRKEASAKFYSFLMLKKHSAIELKQREPYRDILATPGSGFFSL